MALRPPRVRWAACSADGQIVEQLELTHEHFYDGPAPIIDRHGRAMHADGTVTHE